MVRCVRGLGQTDKSDHTIIKDQECQIANFAQPTHKLNAFAMVIYLLIGQISVGNAPNAMIKKQ